MTLCEACACTREVPATHVYIMVTVKGPRGRILICEEHAAPKHSFALFAGTIEKLPPV